MPRPQPPSPILLRCQAGLAGLAGLVGVALPAVAAAGPTAAQLQALEAALPPGRWMTPAQALQLGLPAPVRRLFSSA